MGHPMQGFWANWLVAGLLLAAAGAVVGALETVLWRTPRGRIGQRARSPVLEALAADFAHPRDCLLAFLILAGALARGAGWWTLCVAGVLAGRQVSQPAWAWALVFLLPAVLLEVVMGAAAARRSRAWEMALMRAGRVILRAAGPAFDRAQPSLAAFARRLFPKTAAPRVAPSPEEAETLVRVLEEEGALTLPEAEVLTEVFRLSTATVRHYMTPRVDVVFVEDGMTNDEVRALLLKRHFVRAPVIGDTPDEVVGLLDTRILGRLPEGMHFTEALLPPSFVPETMEASALLTGFLKHRQPLAVVLDEFGGVEGVVTLDDFVEELLGDAAPRATARLYIERLGDDRLLASGTAHLDDLSEYLGFDARQEGIETIGGYVVNKLGRLPRPGTSVRLGAWKVTVRAVSQKRVREVTLQKVRRTKGKEEAK